MCMRSCVLCCVTTRQRARTDLARVAPTSAFAYIAPAQVAGPFWPGPLRLTRCATMSSFLSLPGSLPFDNSAYDGTWVQCATQPGPAPTVTQAATERAPSLAADVFAVPQESMLETSSSMEASYASSDFTLLFSDLVATPVGCLPCRVPPPLALLHAGCMQDQQGAPHTLCNPNPPPNAEHQRVRALLQPRCSVQLSVRMQCLDFHAASLQGVPASNRFAKTLRAKPSLSPGAPAG